MFEPWQLGLIDEAGYNGIRPEHIRRVGDELNKLPYDNLDEQDFRSACRRACIDPDNFTSFEGVLSTVADTPYGDPVRDGRGILMKSISESEA